MNTLNQFSKTTCWRLSHIMDAFGGMIVFSYIQHISNVAKGEESKQYCICSYLYRITVYLNQIETEKILFEYEEKNLKNIVLIIHCWNDQMEYNINSKSYFFLK